MKQYFILVLVILFLSSSSFTQQKKHWFINEFSNYGRRTDYFNWKVYITGDKTFLASIKEIEYNLDRTFKNSRRIINRQTGGENFVLCANGWGEFMIRIKITFANSAYKPIYDSYYLDLHSATRKKTNYRCP